MGQWYLPQISLCAFMPGFTGSEDGYDLWYDCGYEEEMYLNRDITEKSTCETYVDCSPVSFTPAADVCIGTYCIWYSQSSACYCHYIEDPFSSSDGCDQCKFDTPAPTYEGQCDCNTDLGYGIEDSEGECQCDIEFLKGDDCNGGTGTGSFDSGLVPFAEMSCKYDSSTDSYRMITCSYEDTLKVDWFSDNDCTILDVSYMIRNNTCYYASGSLESVQPTDAPTRSPVDSEAPTPAPTMTDAPTLSPIVEDNTLCDRAQLLLELNDFFYDFGDQQWIDDCLTLMETETESPPIVCGCLGKFPKWMANQYLNCKLTDQYHGLVIWHMCYPTIYAQSCGSMCTGWLRRREVQYDRRRVIADTTFRLTWAQEVCQGNTNIASDAPSSFPTLSPTGIPTDHPSLYPTFMPSLPPTTAPTTIPSGTPSLSPTGTPTYYPSLSPTFMPSLQPTTTPTDIPSISPSGNPSYRPSMLPTYIPSFLPTTTPTNTPSKMPSDYPSSLPGYPTDLPTSQPTSLPTSVPSDLPTRAPTRSPTINPIASCNEVKSWSEATQEATCPQGSWGKTNRGHGTMFACESDHQLRLEESMANEFYAKCTSWCVYDFQSTINEVYGAHIWRPIGCWDYVTRGHCFKDLTLYNSFVSYTKTLCTETA